MSAPEVLTYAQVPNWLLRRKEITPSAKNLYARLLQYEGDNKSSWPAIRSLGEEIGLSERQIKRNIQRLEQYGLIKVVRPTDGIHTSRYSIVKKHVWMKEAKTPRKTRSCAASISTTGGDMDDTSGCHGCHPPGDMGDTRRVTSASPKKITEEISEETNEEIKKPKMLASLASAVDFTNVKLDIGSLHKKDLDCVHNSGDSAAPLDFDKGVLPNMPPVTDSDLAKYLAAHPPETKTTTKDEDDAQDKPKVEVETVESDPLALGRAAIESGLAKNRSAIEKRNVKEWGSPNPTAKEKLAKLNQFASRIPGSIKPACNDLEAVWIQEFRAKFPGETCLAAWGPRDLKNAARLIVTYGGEKVVADAMRYYIRYFEHHRPRMFKGSTVLPTFGQLYAAHAQLVPEASKMLAAFEAKTTYDDWRSKNRSALTVPKDILDAYNKAKDDLKSLGI